MSSLLFMAFLFLGVQQQPVGEFAVATNRDGNWEIYSISDDGRTAKNLTNNPAQDLDPSWFPDGKKIAFYSNRAGNSDIYVMNADGTGVTNLTSHEATDTGPAVSPDGKYILFMSTRDHAEGEIYVMDADGGNVRRLTNNDLYEELPSWSPDGRQIAFCRQLAAETEAGATNAEIFLMNVNGSNVRRLTHLDSFDSCPVWNIDGKRLAFHYSDKDGAGIMSLGSDGQDLKVISQPTGDWYPNWLPGNRILFVSGAGSQYNVYVMNADGSGRRRLTEHPGRDHQPVLRPAVR
jgi:TolB protein